MKFSMKGQEKCDLLIQVTAQAGLTVVELVETDKMVRHYVKRLGGPIYQLCGRISTKERPKNHKQKTKPSKNVTLHCSDAEWFKLFTSGLTRLPNQV